MAQKEFSFSPIGLSGSQLATLQQQADELAEVSSSRVAVDVCEHLERVRAAAAESGLVHVRLAESLGAAILKVLTLLDEDTAGRWLPCSNWLKAAAMYFARTCDSDHDLQSPTGFDDDAEIWNACVTMAGLDAYVVDPEEFDDA